MATRIRRRRRKPPASRWHKLAIPLVVIGGIVAVAGGIGASWALSVYNSAPPLSSLQPVQKGRSSAIYAADGSLIGFIRSDNIRQPIPERALPQTLKEATIAIEDKNFYKHGAIDPEGIARAAWKDILAGGKPVQGASTITQQLVRNLYIQDPDHTIKRKLIEAHLAQETGGSPRQGVDPHRLPQHLALRDGRRADRGRGRGGGADLLQQAGQGPQPERVGADRRPAAGPLRIQPLPRPGRRHRAPQRGAGDDGGAGVHHHRRIQRGDRQGPRPQPRRQVPGDPRCLPLRPRPAAADRALRDQHRPQRRPQGVHDDRPRPAGEGRGSGRKLVLRLLPRRRAGGRPRLGQPRDRRDRRPCLDRRLRLRRTVQLRLAGPSPARLLVQDLRPDDGDQAGNRPGQHLLRR